MTSKQHSKFEASLWLQHPWPVAQAATLACLLEATSPKAGNVHPTADFSDMSYVDFLVTAAAIQPAFNEPHPTSVGGLVISSVQATRDRLNVNTNLGTLLLLAPLACAAAQCSGNSRNELREKVTEVLAALSSHDAQQVYAAIRLANPGGLGASDKHDVRHNAPTDLIEAMRIAADRDAVAKQYVNGFADIFGSLLVWLDELTADYPDMRQAVSVLQLRWLSEERDGLIVRKVGSDAAAKVQSLAADAYAEAKRNLGTTRVELLATWQTLDTYLRSDGHRLNPGTTADLIAATLFVRLITNTESNRQT